MPKIPNQLFAQKSRGEKNPWRKTIEISHHISKTCLNSQQPTFNHKNPKSHQLQARTSNKNVTFNIQKLALA
jgi:hypothetical protein